jgi:hypothetical protein
LGALLARKLLNFRKHVKNARALVFGVVCSLPFFSDAQIVVLDQSDSSAVSFALIENLSTKTKTFCNQQGLVLLDNPSIGDSLLLSCFGYSSKRVVLKNNSFTIYLAPNITLLNEVVVRDKPQKKVVPHSTKHRIGVTSLLGFEFVKQIALPKEDLPARLKSIKVKIKSSANQTARVTLYANNNGVPGLALTNKLMLLPKSHGKYVEIPLEWVGIIVHSEFFVGVEIVESENYIKRSKRYKVYLAEDDNRPSTFFRPFRNQEWMPANADFGLSKLLGVSQLDLIVSVRYD